MRSGGESYVSFHCGLLRGLNCWGDEETLSVETASGPYTTSTLFSFYFIQYRITKKQETGQYDPYPHVWLFKLCLDKFFI